MVNPETISDQSSPRFQRRIFPALVFLLLVGLCVVNILLVRQNQDLRESVARLQPELLKVGGVVPSFTANTLSGKKNTVNFAEKSKTILFVFSPNCAACELAVPYWRAIEQAAARDGYQSFGLSIGDEMKSAAFLSANDLDFETFPNLNSEMRSAFKISGTPITIVVDGNGSVEKVWHGAFNLEMKHDVEGYFGISDVDSRQ